MLMCSRVFIASFCVIAATPPNIGSLLPTVLHLGGLSGLVNNSAGQQCLFKSSRHSHLLPTDAVIFDGNAKVLPFDTEKLTRYRKENPHQIWAFFASEAPPKRAISTAPVYHLMNITGFFGKEADYSYSEIDLVWWKHWDRESILKADMWAHKGSMGRSDILFLQSNCNTNSRRESLVGELMKHISVDAVGSCLRNIRVSTHKHALMRYHSEWRKHAVHVKSMWKFVLAFENTIYPDYVTEKLVQCFYAGTIPIYLGTSNVDDYDPGKIAGVHTAIISVRDFDNVRSLAAHIRQVSTNYTMYKKYFEFLNVPSERYVLSKHIKALLQKQPRFKYDRKQSFKSYMCDLLYKKNISSYHSNSDMPPNVITTWKDIIKPN